MPSIETRLLRRGAEMKGLAYQHVAGQQEGRHLLHPSPSPILPHRVMPDLSL
jgi:hypothetical protein